MAVAFCNICNNALEVNRLSREPFTWLPVFMGPCCMSCGALVELGISSGSWRDDFEFVTRAEWAAAYAPIYNAAAPERAIAQARATFNLRHLGVMLANKALDRGTCDGA